MQKVKKMGGGNSVLRAPVTGSRSPIHV